MRRKRRTYKNPSNYLMLFVTALFLAAGFWYFFVLSNCQEKEENVSSGDNAADSMGVVIKNLTPAENNSYDISESAHDGLTANSAKPAGNESSVLDSLTARGD